MEQEGKGGEEGRPVGELTQEEGWDRPPTGRLHSNCPALARSFTWAVRMCPSNFNGTDLSNPIGVAGVLPRVKGHMSFKALHNFGPGYLKVHLFPYIPTCTL